MVAADFIEEDLESPRALLNLVFRGSPALYSKGTNDAFREGHGEVGAKDLGSLGRWNAFVEQLAGFGG
jgi:hypothetical protein